MGGERSSVSTLVSILAVLLAAWAAHALVLGGDESRDTTPAVRSEARAATRAGSGIDVAVFGFG